MYTILLISRQKNSISLGSEHIFFVQQDHDHNRFANHNFLTKCEHVDL